MREDRFTGRVAFITGAGGAIGGAAARGFAREGAKVVVVDFDPIGGQKTVDDIIAAGGEAIFIQADVGKDEECEKAVQIAYDTYGHIVSSIIMLGLSVVIFQKKCLKQNG